MKLSPFAERHIKKISEDWLAKICCLVLALFLYLFYQAVSLERKSFVLPLTVQSTGMMTSVATIQRSVRVTVRGKAQDISLISEHDFEVFIDFSQYTQEGEHSVPVQLKIADNLLAIDPLEVRFFPDSVPVTMETLVYEYVPVNAILFSEPGYGFSLREHTVTPLMARISGPRSMVHAVTAIDTEGISLENRNASFSASVKLFNENSLIRIDEPEAVNVHVVITAKEAFKTFSVPVAVINLHEELTAQLDQSTLEVYVSGSQLDLEHVTAPEFSAQIDCARIFEPGSYTLPVTVSLPLNVFMEASTTTEITLNIMEAQ